jgi:hypothetical protein
MKTMYIAIHEWDVPPHDPNTAWLWNFVTGTIYNPILSMVKMSVLLFLLRLGGTKLGVRRAIWVLIIVNGVSTVVNFFVFIFICDPLAFSWSPKILGAHCPAKIPLSFFRSAWNMATNIGVLIVPYWILLGLRMHRRTKVAILFVFFLGFA